MIKKFLWLTLICIHTVTFVGAGERHSIGLASGMVYLSDDKKFDPGLQLEYSYSFMQGKSPFSVGSAVEVIFGEERHIGLGLQMGYSPIKGWDVGVGPGVMFEGDTHYFCINIATSYGFDLGKISIGPAVELAHTGMHYHFLTGLFIELDF